MFRTQIVRLGAVAASTALLAVMLLGAPGASASTPAGWGLTASSIVATISPGAAQGYTVTVSNAGPSNISKLYLTASDVSNGPSGTPVSPAYTSLAGCNTGVNQGCPLGAFPAGQTMVLTLAYNAAAADTTKFQVEFDINTSGYVLGKNASHGDTLPFTPPATTVSSSPDFAGGYDISGTGVFSTSNSLSKKNTQWSAVSTSDSLIGVTVQEGSAFPDSGTDPCTATGVTCVGQWDSLNVGNGAPHPIKLVMTILGNSVSGHPALSSFNVWHSGDGLITTQCSSPTNPSTVPCRITSMVGNNYQIVVWLTHNGGVRGQFG